MSAEKQALQDLRPKQSMRFIDYFVSEMELSFVLLAILLLPVAIVKWFIAGFRYLVDDPGLATVDPRGGFWSDYYLQTLLLIFVVAVIILLFKSIVVTIAQNTEAKSEQQKSAKIVTDLEKQGWSFSPDWTEAVSPSGNEWFWYTNIERNVDMTSYNDWSPNIQDVYTAEWRPRS